MKFVCGINADAPGQHVGRHLRVRSACQASFDDMSDLLIHLAKFHRCKIDDVKLGGSLVDKQKVLKGIGDQRAFRYS